MIKVEEYDDGYQVCIVGMNTSFPIEPLEEIINAARRAGLTDAFLSRRDLYATRFTRPRREAIRIGDNPHQVALKLAEWFREMMFDLSDRWVFYLQSTEPFDEEKLFMFVMTYPCWEPK